MGLPSCIIVYKENTYVTSTSQFFGKMPSGKIFFSYAHSDSEFALKIASDLRLRNHDVWIDQIDIKPGTRWDSEVERALLQCEKLLVIISPNSILSSNVLDEIAFYLEEKKEIIPLIKDDCKLPFRIRRLQFIDFTKNYSTAFIKLIETLKSENAKDSVIKNYQDSISFSNIQKEDSSTALENGDNTKIINTTPKDKIYEIIEKNNSIDEKIIKENQNSGLFTKKSVLIFLSIIFILGCLVWIIFMKQKPIIDKTLNPISFRSDLGEKLENNEYPLFFTSNTNLSYATSVLSRLSVIDSILLALYNRRLDSTIFQVDRLNDTTILRFILYRPFDKMVDGAAQKVFKSIRENPIDNKPFQLVECNNTSQKIYRTYNFN